MSAKAYVRTGSCSSATTGKTRCNHSIPCLKWSQLRSDCASLGLARLPVKPSPAQRLFGTRHASPNLHEVAL